MLFIMKNTENFIFSLSVRLAISPDFNGVTVLYPLSILSILDLYTLYITVTYLSLNTGM